MSEHERYYTKEADDGETAHMTRHIVKNNNDVKTLDVKIMELREDPDNI